MCFYTGIRENCDPGRKPGEGDEKRESPRDIGRVGKYTVQCIITTLPFFFSFYQLTVVLVFMYSLPEMAVLSLIRYTEGNR